MSKAFLGLPEQVIKVGPDELSLGFALLFVPLGALGRPGAIRSLHPSPSVRLLLLQLLW